MANTLKVTRKILENIVENTINEVMNEITAYHGTDANFDNFDLAYMGTGAGKQDYGYGIYLSILPDGTQQYGKNAYTVEIPSDNKKYLIADKVYSPSFVNKLKNKLYQLIITQDDTYKGAEKELIQDLNITFNDINGNNIYGSIETYLGSDKRTSEFLYSMGFIGLKYRNGKYENVVMFNPKDIKIINKKLG